MGSRSETVSPASIALDPQVGKRLGSSRHVPAVDLKCRRAAPAGNPQVERKTNTLGHCQLQLHGVAEGIIGRFGDGYRGAVADLGGDFRGGIERSARPLSGVASQSSSA